MRTLAMFPVFVLLAYSLQPASAQTGTGTPGPNVNAARNPPIPQRLIPSHPKGPTGTLTTDKPRYAPGQPISLTFTVTNSTKKDAIYNFSTGQQCDFTATDAKGTNVWTWSHERMFTQVLTRLALAPGQKRVYKGVWEGQDAQGKPIKPGVYTLTARLTPNNGPAIVGGVAVNTDTDPNNMGMPTHTPAETGAIRAVDVTPPVMASVKITITAPTRHAK